MLVGHMGLYVTLPFFLGTAAIVTVLNVTYKLTGVKNIIRNPRYFVNLTIDCEDVENLPVGFRLCYVDWPTVSDGDRFA